MPADKCVPIAKELMSTPEQLAQFLKPGRSIRACQEKPVEHEELAKLMDIVRYAPSSHNSQPVHWLLIEKRQDVKEVAQLTIDWIRGLAEKDPATAEMLQAGALVAYRDSGIGIITRWAPHLVLAHAQTGFALDCHTALAYLELAAHSMGIGTRWAGFVMGAATSHPPLTQALQLPEGHSTFGAMIIGYPKHKFSRIPIGNDAQVTWR